MEKRIKISNYNDCKNSKFIRLTNLIFPSFDLIGEKWHFPLGTFLRPMWNEEKIRIVIFVNPFMWDYYGRRFVCNICDIIVNKIQEKCFVNSKTDGNLLNKI